MDFANIAIIPRTFHSNVNSDTMNNRFTIRPGCAARISPDTVYGPTIKCKSLLNPVENYDCCDERFSRRPSPRYLFLEIVFHRGIYAYHLAPAVAAIFVPREFLSADVEPVRTVE